MSSLPLASDPLPAVPFSGQVVVFTGKLASLGRREASALVERLGGATADEVSARTTIVVLGAEGFAPRAKNDREDADPPASSEDDEAARSNKLRRVEELNRRRAGSVRIIGEDEFCRMAGVPTREVLTQQYYPLKNIRALYRTLTDAHVRALAKWGLVTAVAETNTDRYFSFPDLLVLRQVHAELEAGTALRTIVRSLLAERHGQLALDFRPLRSDAHPAKVVRLERPPKPVSVTVPLMSAAEQAARCFHEASGLDEGDDVQQEQAVALYRRSLALDPDLVPALVNLANIHYGRDQVVEAQALYERAVTLDPECFEAHFNLGNIHHDLGRYGEAQLCYRDALALNPEYADAQFYLAVTLEKMGLSLEAKPHWRAYQKLAPDGEWLELAREFSD